MSTIKVESKINPSLPTTRYFAISGTKPITIPLQFSDSKIALESGFPLASSILKAGAKEARIYFNDQAGVNLIVVDLDNKEKWGRVAGQTNTGGNAAKQTTTTTFETAVQGLITKHVEQGYPLTSEHAIKATLAEINAHLQKSKPTIIDEHGGIVIAKAIDETRGILTVQFSGICVSNCPGGKEITESLIVSPIINKFPGQVRQVHFV